MIISQIGQGRSVRFLKNVGFEKMSMQEIILSFRQLLDAWKSISGEKNVFFVHFSCFLAIFFTFLNDFHDFWCEKVEKSWFFLRKSSFLKKKSWNIQIFPPNFRISHFSDRLLDHLQPWQCVYNSPYTNFLTLLSKFACTLLIVSLWWIIRRKFC